MQLPVNSLQLDNPFLSSADYFFTITFFIFLRKYQSQTISNQFKTKVLSVLIWVLTVCKGNERTPLAGKELMAVIL